MSKTTAREITTPPNDNTIINLMSDDIRSEISRVLGVDLQYIDKATIVLETGEPVYLETKSHVIGRLE